MKSNIELVVSENVRKLRMKRNWSYKYLGDCINVSGTFIYVAESPKSDKAFNLDHIDALARVFKCKIWDLIPQYPVNDPLSDN